MASFTGIHVTHAPLAVGYGNVSLIGYAVWAQTLTSPGKTNWAATEDTSIMQVTATVDAFFAVGPNPDASQVFGEGQAARHMLLAGTTKEIFCTKGDKLAWLPA